MEWDLEAEEWSWRPEFALEFYYIFTLIDPIGLNITSGLYLAAREA